MRAIAVIDDRIEVEGEFEFTEDGWAFNLRVPEHIDKGSHNIYLKTIDGRPAAEFFNYIEPGDLNDSRGD